MKFKIGNYVRCPLDINEEPNFREYISGKISSVDEFSNKINAKIEDIYDTRHFFERIPKNMTCEMDDINRVKIISGTLAIYRNEYVVKIVSFYKEIEGYYLYYAYRLKDQEIIEIVNEKDLSIQFDSGEISPLDQMKNYEFHNPVWYKGRVNMSKMDIALENSPVGVELILGSRIYLFQHQMETIMKGLTSRSCRIMLADEVGLGKTIEACVIYKGLKERNHKLKTLIVVPTSLVNQWQNELSYKFWIDVNIWNGKSKSIDDELIVSLEDINKFKEINGINNYDLLIVDEAHRLLNDSQSYEGIYDYSQRIDNIILLSATPIQQRQTEYLKLLRLLHPDKYMGIDTLEFEELLEKNKKVKNDMYELIRDLNYYEEDDAGEDYIEEFLDMNKYLKDPILGKLIDEIDVNNTKNGLETVKIILAYISNTYEIERDIIRNRRIELKDEFSKRTKSIFYYKMQDSLEGFYEEETYNMVIEYLQERFEVEEIDIKLVKDIYGRMLSSPWALKAYLRKLKSEVNSNTEVVQALDRALNYNDLWLNASLEELSSMKYYEDYPEQIKSRILFAIDMLDENYYDKKVAIFTNFKETAIEFAKYLKIKTGEDSVSIFTEDMNSDELEESVNKFQEQEECKFIVCDKTGGEGRNLQMADCILHLDVPWNPVELEQRVGRLDRIGRDTSKEVESIIIMSEDTIEEDIFKLWDEGLNIFEESLSGIEIALNDIEKEIEDALSFDIAYGLKNSLLNIKEDIVNMKIEVDREKYYDTAKNMDSNKIERINKIIDKFEGDDNKLLKHTMLTWFGLAGFSPDKINVRDSKGEMDLIIKYSDRSVNISSVEKALFAPPDTRKALKRSRNKREIRGTFSKDLAINMEDLILFSPGDSIYDSINENALRSFRGRSSAFAIKADIDWIGLVFIWNVKFNQNYLLDEGINPQLIEFNYNDYLPLEQFETYYKIIKNVEDVSNDKIKEIADEWLKLDIREVTQVHLGKRSFERKFFKNMGNSHASNVDWIKNVFPRDKWVNVLDNMYRKSKQEVLNQLKDTILVSKAKEELENIIISEKAKNIYYNNHYIDYLNRQEDNEVLFNAILEGLRDPVIELDSLSNIWMVKDDGFN